MPTPHNSAAKGDFAKTVLMPGDPLRSKYIAENFLTEPVSYTHLDVYKRQSPPRGRPGPSRSAARPPR